jgi:thiamine biosynthesis protein ThiS
MLTITVNGRQQEFESDLTGEELLQLLDRNAATLVVERNGQIVPMQDFLAGRLLDGDVLELVTLVGGG